MRKHILNFYRSLPLFKGKLRLGKLLFPGLNAQPGVFEFRAHGGISYKIPNTIENIGLELLINGIYEEDVVKFLQKQVKPNDVFFDIGANIGAIGLPVIKHIGNIAYYGFEASPFTFEYLQYNFRKNVVPNYELHNNLIHENDGEKMKFYESKFYGKSSLAPTYTTDFIMVDSLSLDSFCKTKNIQVINWMKIDVQGFELNVFAGLKEMLKQKQIENILFEFEPWAEKEAGFEPGAAQSMLQSLGYELFDIDNERLGQGQPVKSDMIWAKPKAEF